MWAVSGVYLSFPNPFQDVVDRLQPLDDSNAATRSGDEVLRWLARLHFGRFGGWPIKALWTILGMIPLLLFVTGAVMWWNRVLRRWVAETRRQPVLAPVPVPAAFAAQVTAEPAD
jgi:uncharacterized iron-regulated membrane protein